VVFPAALAAAQDVRCSGEEFLTACVVGYEVADRVGEFLGMKHYHVYYLQFRYCANRRTSTQRPQQEHLARPPLSHGSSNYTSNNHCGLSVPREPKPQDCGSFSVMRLIQNSCIPQKPTSMVYYRHMPHATDSLAPRTF